MSEEADLLLTVRIDAKTARKYKLSRTLIRDDTFAMGQGKVSLTLKLPAKARKAFRKLNRLSVTVTAVITRISGTTGTDTLKVTLRKK